MTALLVRVFLVEVSTAGEAFFHASNNVWLVMDPSNRISFLLIGWYRSKKLLKSLSTLISEEGSGQVNSASRIVTVQLNHVTKCWVYVSAKSVILI